jgi:orotate phosphoribosyltransferase
MKIVTSLGLGEDLMHLSMRCGATYICPKNGSIRAGKLVAYAGKDFNGKNKVGDIYFNYRKVEQYPAANEAFAEEICRKIRKYGLVGLFDTVVGISNGGRTLGGAVARILGKKFTYPEKKPKPMESGRKQEYEWDLSQFEFEPGEIVCVVEDVFNNFQNTDNTLAEIVSAGVEVGFLAGALNRSPVYDTFYTPKSGPYASKGLLIIAAIQEAFPEYDQDDPEVAADVAAGNLEFEVKKNWAALRASMRS